MTAGLYVVSYPRLPNVSIKFMADDVLGCANASASNTRSTLNISGTNTNESPHPETYFHPSDCTRQQLQYNGLVSRKHDISHTSSQSVGWRISILHIGQLIDRFSGAVEGGESPYVSIAESSQHLLARGIQVQGVVVYDHCAHKGRLFHGFSRTRKCA